MSILIACEESATVRDAFIKRGYDAWSCDLLPTRGRQGNHIVGDVIEVLSGNLSKFDCVDIRTGNKPLFRKWDALIAFPPCTHLAVSGARWFETKQVEQRKAIWFFKALAEANIPKIAIENPIGIMSTLWRKPDQIIQPWQFGHGETKATCLWLKGLPPLSPTEIVSGREARIHKMPPGPNRSRDRSVTYQGIADAMADQWGPLV